MNRIIVIVSILSICFFPAGIHAQSETTDKFTSNHKQLTSDSYRKGYADWSPDGKYVIFTSNRDKKDDEEGDLWRISIESGDWLQITRSSGHHGVYSPDGKYIVYDAALGSIVRVIPSDGGIPIRIVPESVNVEHSGNPCWSPDGSQIAFRAFEDLMILDLSSGNITSVFQKDNYKPMPIQWSKTDNSILIALVCPEKKDGELWKIPLDGSDAKRMTFHKTYISQATLSPCEKFILFSSIVDMNGYDLYVIPFEGGKDLKITDDPGHYVEPCWCPVDNRVVFTSTRSGGIDLWTMELNIEKIEEELRSLNRMDEK